MDEVCNERPNMAQVSTPFPFIMHSAHCTVNIVSLYLATKRFDKRQLNPSLIISEYTNTNYPYNFINHTTFFLFIRCVLSITTMNGDNYKKNYE